MALNTVGVPTVKGSSGGGIMGTLGKVGAGLASLGGLIAAPFTYGASLPIAGAVAGGLAGASTLADVANPGEEGKQVPAVPLSAPERKLQGDPRAVIGTLNESIAALQRQDQKTRSAYEPFLMAAKQAAESRMA